MHKQEKIMRRKNHNDINTIFNDLDAYREWCVEFGFVFDEKNLYKSDTPWGLFNRYMNGDKTIRSNWERDRKRQDTHPS